LVIPFEEARQASNDLRIQSIKISEQEIIFTKKMKPEEFNNKLNNFFILVSTYLDKSSKVTELKNKYYSEKVLDLTANVLKTAYNKIKAIKSPIVDNNFNKSFYGQMNSLAAGFNSQNKQYRTTLVNFKNDYNVLTTKVSYPILTRSPSSIKTIDLEKE
jgi:hypothetical protein